MGSLTYELQASVALYAMNAMELKKTTYIIVYEIL
jgi:hypothetical protein